MATTADSVAISTMKEGGVVAIDEVGIGIAALQGYERTVDAAVYLALEGLVLLEAVRHDGLALRGCEDIGTQTDDAT